MSGEICFLSLNRFQKTEKTKPNKAQKNTNKQKIKATTTKQTNKKPKNRKVKNGVQCFFDLCLKGGTIDTRSAPCSQAAGKMFAEGKSSCDIALCHLMVLIPFSKHILDNRSAQAAGQSLTVGTVTCPELPAQLRAVGRAGAWLKLLQLLVLSGTCL